MASFGPVHGRVRLALMRPEDNLVLNVTGIGLDVEAGEHGIPFLARAKSASSAGLIVSFPPQHVAEQVFQEHLPLNQGGGHETPTLPAGARFAGLSRLAFLVPDGEQIELTVAGILAAMSRLQLSVVPLAVPRRIWYLWQARQAGPVIQPAPILAAAAQPAAAPAAALSGGALAIERVRASRLLAATGFGAAVQGLDPDARRAIAALPLAERASAFGGVAELAQRDFADLVRLLRNPDPRPPLSTETAIELPSRLQLSPSVEGGFAHATRVDEERGDGTGAVELWHSRLGVRGVAEDGTVSVDENDATQRIVRAVWTRDIQSWDQAPPTAFPFRTSTTPFERKAFVQLSSGPGLPTWASPDPIDINRLALSSLGAFVDLRGVWPPNDTGVLEWQHRTTLGRDQYVKVVLDGYMFPFGHRAVFVIETKRKVDPNLPLSDDTAILWQRKFIILKELTRGYPQRSMPFTSVTLAPHTTPDLNDPGDDPDYFWPSVGTALFPFIVSGVDHDGQTHVYPTPLLWVKAPMKNAADVLTQYGLQKVGSAFKNIAPGDGKVEMGLAGRRIAVAPTGPSGEATYETQILRFAGEPESNTSTPSLLFAQLIVPAVAAVTGQRKPLKLSYAAPYLASGFDGGNSGEVVLQTAADATAGSLSFAGSTDKSGGFLDPGQAIDGVSRRLGPVADVANSATGNVDPAKLFAGFGKLFGLFELADVLASNLGLDQMPAYAARLLDIVSALDGHLNRVAELLPSAPPAVAAAKAALKNAATAFDTLTASPPADFDAAKAQFKTLIDTQLEPAVQQAKSAVPEIAGLGEQAIAGRTLDTLTTLLSPPPGIPGADELLARVARGEPVASLLNHVHLEWSPPLEEWPAGAPIFKPSRNGNQGKLLLAVDVRGGDLVASPSTEIVAQLTDFTLQLVPGAPLLGIGFERLLFKASTGSKTDVDVVLDDLAWQGILGFVEKLKELIPLDGFSDPPNLQVDASGIAAGFTVGLPNLAVGVFNLSNLSLGADLKLPFVGDAPTVGFSFCTRERPFTLAVMFLGGGGFFGLRLNPKGVVLLEASLEFGACLALDFVVASGSVSCMAGVYLRLEADKGSLTGYLRIRGEVDVLGLISASIEMYMGLTYEFGSGKVIGRASITVEVEVLFFSASVEISCERKFAGSGGDPTFADAMGPYADDGPWVSYCQAFAG